MPADVNPGTLVSFPVVMGDLSIKNKVNPLGRHSLGWNMKTFVLKLACFARDVDFHIFFSTQSVAVELVLVRKTEVSGCKSSSMSNRAAQLSTFVFYKLKQFIKSVLWQNIMETKLVHT